MAIQGAVNQEMLDLLATKFIKRNEPNLAWANLVSIGIGMPRVRGFWPCSSVDENFVVYDVCGQGRNLTGANMADATSGLASYLNFNGTTAFLTRPTEPGLEFAGAGTIGGWFSAFSLGTEMGLISKWGGAGQRSYQLIRAASNSFKFQVSGNGTAVVEVPTNAMTDIDRVYFVAGVFSTGTEVSIYSNVDRAGRLVKTSNIAGVPATMFNSAAPFEVGRSNGGSYLDGISSMMFACDRAVPDFFIESFFWQTRPLFFGE